MTIVAINRFGCAYSGTQQKSEREKRRTREKGERERERERGREGGRMRPLTGKPLDDAEAAGSARTGKWGGIGVRRQPLDGSF